MQSSHACIDFPNVIYAHTHTNSANGSSMNWNLVFFFPSVHPFDANVGEQNTSNATKHVLLFSI